MRDTDELYGAERTLFAAASAASGALAASRSADTANMLACRPVSAPGSRYPSKNAHLREFEHRPRNWPVEAYSGQGVQNLADPRDSGLFCGVRRVPGEASPAPPARTSSGPARGGELVASIRSEPSTYNRYVAPGASAATDVVTFLTQARLVRVNRATDELEPWLADAWTASADGLTYTITLKPGVRFSDGEPIHVGRRPLLVSRRV